jgi:hypothetical protein
LLELRSERKEASALPNINENDRTPQFLLTSSPANPLQGTPHYCAHRFSAESKKLTTRDNLRRDSLATEQESVDSGQRNLFGTFLPSENTATWVKPIRHNHSPATGHAFCEQIHIPQNKPVLSEFR